MDEAWWWEGGGVVGEREIGNGQRCGSYEKGVRNGTRGSVERDTGIGNVEGLELGRRKVEMCNGKRYFGGEVIGEKTGVSE